MNSLLQAAKLVHRALRYRWKLNRGEIKALVSLVPRGGVALDVGAHKGAYAWWLGRCVGKAGRVFAFEPQERVVGPAQASFAVAGMKQVRYVHGAVSDRSGDGAIAVRRESTHGASLAGLDDVEGSVIDQVPVRLIALDDFAREHSLGRVDAIKIDVEGHEFAVLRGAMEILRRFHPVLLIECEGRQHEAGATHPVMTLRSMLEPLGYRGEFFVKGERRPLSEFDPAAHQTYGKGYYSNNFLFSVPRG